MANGTAIYTQGHVRAYIKFQSLSKELSYVNAHVKIHSLGEELRLHVVDLPGSDVHAVPDQPRLKQHRAVMCCEENCTRFCKSVK